MHLCFTDVCMCNNKRFLSFDSVFVLCLIPILPPTSMTDYYPTDLSSAKNTAFYYHNAIHNFKKGLSFGTKGKKAKKYVYRKGRISHVCILHDLFFPCSVTSLFTTNKCQIYTLTYMKLTTRIVNMLVQIKRLLT